MQATTAAGVVMASTMLEAEQVAKASLTPGHGVDTGSMQRMTHVALPMHDWQGEAQKASASTPELGGKLVIPGKYRGKLSLELGCGQDYTVYYHQLHHPFLRIAFENAMSKFRTRVEGAWRLAFK
jgi:hypothetical protein